MASANPGHTTRASAFIKAPREALYRAFTDPSALEAWQAPGEMTGNVHDFDARVGGGYRMSLYYPPTEQANRGKTAAKEDRFNVRFTELTPPFKIVQVVSFDTDDPAFAGDMTMIVTFDERREGTDVTIAFHDIPPGIRLEDNDLGTRLSLQKLARYIEPRGSVEVISQAQGG